MTMELLPASSRLSGNIEETPQKEAAGKPPTMLAPRKAGSLQWKTVKFFVGVATAKQCRANNSKFSFFD